MIRVETDLPCRTDSTICIAFLGLLGDLFALIYIKTLYLKTGKKQWDVFTRYYIFGFYGLFLGYIWKLLVLLVNHYFTNGSYYRILRKVPKSGEVIFFPSPPCRGKIKGVPSIKKRNAFYFICPRQRPGGFLIPFTASSIPARGVRYLRGFSPLCARRWCAPCPCRCRGLPPLCRWRS